MDLDEIKASAYARCEQREAWMLKAFEEEAARSIMRDNPEDFLSWEEQKRRIQTAQAHQQDIRDVIALLPPYEDILSAMQKLGALTTPDAMRH